MSVSQVQMINAKTHLRSLVFLISGRGGGADRKSHAMTSSEIFDRRQFLWNKDTVKWKIISRGIGKRVTKI